ncbi:MAG: hypothetical protein MUF54_10600 [Polyangiaceae bacterium]|jgi:hypothetical protein|nr:hypothetical protein [Polyangiaceae bacterium]
MRPWKNTEARQHLAEHRARADEAPRLGIEVPSLQTLRLALSESRAGLEIPGTSYAKLFVVHSAPAYFYVPCGDPRCKDGGHDITENVMAALRRSASYLEGTDSCLGQIGFSECARELRFIVTAVFA